MHGASLASCLASHDRKLSVILGWVGSMLMRSFRLCDGSFHCTSHFHSSFDDTFQMSRV